MHAPPSVNSSGSYVTVQQLLPVQPAVWVAGILTTYCVHCMCTLYFPEFKKSFVIQFRVTYYLVGLEYYIVQTKHYIMQGRRLYCEGENYIMQG